MNSEPDVTISGNEIRHSRTSEKMGDTRQFKANGPVLPRTAVVRNLAHIPALHVLVVCVAILLVLGLTIVFDVALDQNNVCLLHPRRVDRWHVRP